MRFTNLHMKDFRCARELSIDFEPDVTVIVGRNGAGKTSMLDALAIVFRLSRDNATGADSFGIELGPFAHDVRSGADSSTLQVEFEIDQSESNTPNTKTLTVKLDNYRNPSSFIQLQGPAENWDVASSSLRVIYYRQERGFGPGRQNRLGSSTADILDSEALQDRSLEKNFRVIDELEAWWDPRDAQEARRVRDGERDYRDPQLEAIRKLITKIGDFEHISFNSTASPPGLRFAKHDGTWVHVSSLSSGERSYLILLADLARRLQVFDPSKPVETIQAIVLIDEVELNLHPGWQSEIVPTLTDVFRGCQFIVTTHSPQVLSGVESGKVRVIEEEVPYWSSKVTTPLSTRGRTSNYLLQGVLGARKRFPPLDDLIGVFNEAIDRQDRSTAAETLNKLEQEIAEDVSTLLVLRKRLKKLRGGE